MLDDYKNGQDICYQMLLNSIKYNRLSHAYLFESNNNPNVLDFVLSFVKYICCPYNYTNSSKCVDCNICNRIDSNNYLELKIIKPDGLWIKKEQMINLQDEFSMKSIEGTKRVYIIVDAEKMNAYTANSILKFIEEPSDNIIAILITNNINQMLKTIVSRCQVISLKKDSMVGDDLNFKLASIIFNDKIKINEFLSDTNNFDIISNSLKFIEYFEINGIDSLIYTKNLIHSKFKDREKYIIFMDIIINFYIETLKYKIKDAIIIFNDYLDLIKQVCDNNSVDELIKKLEILIDVKDNIKYNLNLNLLIDKMIIDMEGV